MSASGNAADFRIALRRIDDAERNIFRPVIAQLRSRFTVSGRTNVPSQLAADAEGAMLEAHVRVCLVDRILDALHWHIPRMDDCRPNLFTEVPVASSDTAVTLFLDYFGTERESERPLMIVEAKHPARSLPKPPDGFGSADQIARVIAKGLQVSERRPRGMTKEWVEWLDKLRRYVAGVKERGGNAPARVVLTNGDWLIVFRSPERTFGAEVAPEDIVVFQDREKLSERADEVYRELAYESVADDSSELSPQEVPFYIDAASVNGAMHAVRVLYTEDEQMFLRPLPRIGVTPSILLRSSGGRWREVVLRRQQLTLPRDAEDLRNHIEKMAQDARALMGETCRSLGSTPPLISLEEHYRTREFLTRLPGVKEIRSSGLRAGTRMYLIATGTDTHFVRPEPSVPGCPFHDWYACQSAGHADGTGPLAVPTVEPQRNYFVAGMGHHCAHAGVARAKAAPIGPQNREQCGPRSGTDGDPFCEVFSLDGTLCCRTCVFEEVCTAAPTLTLPCERPPPDARRRLPVM